VAANGAVQSPDERLARSERLVSWLMDPDGCLPCELAIDVERWPAEWRFVWEERAGLMEHHGGLSREVAEREAGRRVREEFARSHRQASG